MSILCLGETAVSVSTGYITLYHHKNDITTSKKDILGANAKSKPSHQNQLCEFLQKLSGIEH